MDNQRRSSPNGGVTKPMRSKVRKACDSCRKRKIKCTGTQPCSSCQAYNCKCVYSGRTIGSSNNVNINISNNDHNYGDYISSYTSNETHISKIINKNGINSSRSSSSTSTSISTSTNSNNNCISTGDSHNDIEIKNANVIKINSGVYEDNTDIEKRLDNLNKVLLQLKDLENTIKQTHLDGENLHINELINSIKEQLAEINNQWQPEIDLIQYKELNKIAVKSVETYLLKNKYSETVPITKFAISGDKQLEQTLINSDANNIDNFTQLKVTQYPVVDEMFGLYSAYEVFSLRGIGTCFIKSIKNQNHCKNISKSIKETLYLTLRFFDMVMSHFHENALSIGNPIESYLQLKKIPISQTPISNANSPLIESNNINNNSNVVTKLSFGNGNTAMPNSPNSASTGSSFSSENTKALVAILIKMLPQPFVEKHTGISNAQLLDSMYDDVLMFKLLLDMYDTHMKSLDKFMGEMNLQTHQNNSNYNSNYTNYNTMNNIVPTIKPADTHKLLNFSNEGELLLVLLYTYYNSTLYMYFNPDSALEYLEMLIRLLDQQVWNEDKNGFYKVLGAAIPRALDMGLSRWEYYVGLDEFYAERRREVWWKLYCHEKSSIVKSGVTSVINDKIMTCLLPKCFRDVGFLDNRDFLSRVAEVKRNEIFDNMDIDTLVFYGKTAILQIYSEFHLNVLLNERFTSIRNASLPPQLKSKRFEEILEQCELTQQKLTAVYEQVKKLYEISKNPSLYETSLPKESIIKAMKYCIYAGNVYATLISTLDNLDARFSSRADDPKVNTLSNIVRLHKLWRDISQIVLRFNDTYCLANNFFIYSTILIIVMTHLGELVDHFTLEDIAVIFKIFGRLSYFPILTENVGYHQVTDSALFKSYCRTFSITAIYCKMLIENFPHKIGMKEEELIDGLGKIAPEIMPLVEACSDPKAWPYRYLMRPVAKSGFHLKIKRMLNYIGVNEGIADENPTSRNNSIFKNIGLSGAVINNNNSFSSVGSSLNKYSKTMDHQMLTPGTTMGNSSTTTDSETYAAQSSGNNDNLGRHPNDFGLMENDFESPAYNLGTLDEFVQNNDLTDLCDALWGDLYTFKY
ncbi:drug-responsive transcription factor PDR1 PWA37_004074 [Arxiozyma heterogenica]|uniref:drug-responsive transcription factor PDR1 n=1 Tax=Arxiozyma heterogenica TaxID=278026 RepID=UPI002EE38615